MKKFLITLFAITTTSFAFAKAPFEVSIQPNRNGFGDLIYGASEIHIVSDTDGLDIKDVIINRGKCSIRAKQGWKGGKHGAPLDFSDKRVYVTEFWSPDKIREIIVKTNKGDYSFSK